MSPRLSVEPMTSMRAPERSSAGPAFLVGAARSGTSLLYRLLCLHPDAAYISNWVARYPRHRWLAALNRLPRALPSIQRRAWFGEDSNAYVYGRRRPLVSRAFPAPHEGEAVYAGSGFDPLAGSTGARPDQARSLRAATADIQRFGGGRVFLSKRIANNRRIPALVQTFPAARFVEIVRDGRAVAYSLSRVDWWETSPVSWFGGTPAEWRARGGDPWELCARNWVEELRQVRDGLLSVPDDQVLRLRYEDFVADPPAHLDEIARFTGLGPSESWSRAVKTLEYPNRNEAWRGALDADTIARITAFQRPELEELGYGD
jgi:hypothetical protein